MYNMYFFSETYIHIGPIALQTSLFILQEKTQSIKNTTKLISNKLNIIEKKYLNQQGIPYINCS